MFYDVLVLSIEDCFFFSFFFFTLFYLRTGHGWLELFGALVKSFKMMPLFELQ